MDAAGKDTCNDPDAAIACSFGYMPATLSDTMVIVATGTEGEPLQLYGTIYKSDGVTPYAGVVLYAYHTDGKGLYSKSGKEQGAQKWHGRLHGWCRTNAKGQYRIHTLRPAPYPDGSLPAHIHAAIKTGEGSMSWISDFVFAGDPLVNKKYIQSINNPGGSGVVTLQKAADSWLGKRDMVLT